MKKKINYLVEWGEKKEYAFSGISYNLYNALKKYYDLKDVDLTKAPAAHLSFFEKVRNRLLGQDIGLKNIINHGKFAMDNIYFKGEEKCSIFQFSENIFDTDQCDTYIYQDLSVSYVEYMMDFLPKTFQMSGFQINNSSSIKKRSIYQNDYYSKCCGIFTMGKWLAKDMITRCGMNPKKVHPVGGGINIDNNCVDIYSREGNKILFVGRDFVRKGGIIVVEAFKKLKKRRKDVELFVAGPPVNPIKEDIAGYHFLGVCDYKKITTLFKMCDIFCMPSYFEAYGLVFIEALTSGLPVIARNAYEMPYLVEDGITGFLIQEDDINELVERMDFVLTDSEIRKNVRERKDFYLSEYNWDKVAERINGVIC